MGGSYLLGIAMFTTLTRALGGGYLLGIAVFTTFTRALGGSFLLGIILLREDALLPYGRNHTATRDLA